jgi:hypothetical protein
MTTLELITDSPPYKFKSLGILDDEDRFIGSSDDFKKDNEYKLTDGKFPLTDYTDEFSESGLYHTLDGNIKVKIIGFKNSCEEGDLNKYGPCKIIVEKAFLGGRKKRNLKNKSKRRRSNRKRSNRRKSNRRR